MTNTLTFPEKENINVSGYSIALDIVLRKEIENWPNAIIMSDSHRMYYLVEYTNGKERLFMTTDEMDDCCLERTLNHDFEWVRSVDEMFRNFDQCEFLKNNVPRNFNSPPKYIYYDIHFINDRLKELFKMHLEESISGYATSDLSKHEWERIAYWKLKLERE